MITSHSLSSPWLRLLRLAEPTRSKRSSTIDDLGMDVNVGPPFRDGNIDAEAVALVDLADRCDQFQPRGVHRFLFEPAVGGARHDHDDFGRSASAIRWAIAAAILPLVKYWFSK